MTGSQLRSSVEATRGLIPKCQNRNRPFGAWLLPDALFLALAFYSHTNKMDSSPLQAIVDTVPQAGLVSLPFLMDEPTLKSFS